jgi:hypothetical protein
MKEPRRLLEGGVDEFERDLLASSDVDVPTNRAYQRTLSSIGVGLMLPLSATAIAQGAGATVAAPAAKFGLLALGKWLAVGAVAGAVTASGAHLTTRALSSAPQRAPALSSAPLHAPPASARLAEEPVVEVPVAEPGSGEPAPTPRVPQALARKPAELSLVPTGLPASSPPLEPPPAREPALTSSLEGEVAAIETARRALGRGAARSALVTLQGYYREFPAGVLQPEARVLEVSALVQAGERESARELGRRIVARDPAGAHAQTVRSLLPELEKP